MIDPTHRIGPLGLLASRRFGPFFWTQLLGALNDNVLKNALAVMLAFGALATGGWSEATLVNLAAGLFILPFFLFSATAGQLADRSEKGRLIRALKVAEFLVMVVAAGAFAVGSSVLLLGALFLLGAQAAFFGPVKYSILPQHLRPEELVTGNALVQTGTFVAILAGTILGGLLAAQGGTAVSAAVLAAALAGWAASLGIPRAPADDPTLRVSADLMAETWRTIGWTRITQTIFLSTLGIGWFWFYGALFVAQLPGLGHDVLGGDERLVTFLLTVFAVGVAVGCGLCERLAAGRVELGLVPLGAFGLTVFGIDLALATGGFVPPAAPLGPHAFLAAPGSWRIVADMTLLGLAGGFHVVPLQALVQQRSPASHRARIIAGGNIISAAFMTAAAGLAIALRGLGLGIPGLFLATAVANALVAGYIFTVVPEFAMRFLIWLLVHTVYRLRTRGLEHLPAEGAALLVCNHVSFVDALVIAAACHRPVRFLMDAGYYRMPLLGFVFRTGRAIPIASRRDDPQTLARAWDEVARALETGDLVCVFPEGAITRTGDLGPFRPGVERILARTPVPVVPMALRGLWGSFFSREGGHAMRRPLRRVWSRIELVCGAPLPPARASVATLRSQVEALRGDWR